MAASIPDSRFPVPERRMRGASAGVMLLMIVWSVRIIVGVRTLLDFNDGLGEFIFYPPGSEQAVLADVIVNCAWMVGGAIGVYLLARTDRGAPSYWIAYLALSAAAFAALLAWPGGQTPAHAVYRMWWITVSLAIALYMMFSRGVRQTFGSNGFSLGPLEDFRRRLQAR